MYEKALKLVKTAHAGQTDKGGIAYINHLLTVAGGVSGETEKTVALLHDIIEDTPTTLDGLRKQGFPDEVIAAVDCLTKRKGEPYEGYISRVKSNPCATRVKLADLRHNMDTGRLSNITDKDSERVKKYEYAVAYLTDSSP